MLIPLVIVHSVLRDAPAGIRPLAIETLQGILTRAFSLHLDDISQRPNADDILKANCMLDSRWLRSTLTVTMTDGSIRLANCNRLVELKAALKLRDIMDQVEMSPEEAVVFNQLWNSRANERAYMSLSDLLTIAGHDEWVSNGAFDHYVTATNKHLRPLRKLCLSNFFSQSLESCLDIGNTPQLWRTWVSYQSLDIIVENVHLFFVPVCINDHWRLLVLNLEKEDRLLGLIQEPRRGIQRSGEDCGIS